MPSNSSQSSHLRTQGVNLHHQILHPHHQQEDQGIDTKFHQGIVASIQRPCSLSPSAVASGQPVKVYNQLYATSRAQRPEFFTPEFSGLATQTSSHTANSWHQLRHQSPATATNPAEILPLTLSNVRITSTNNLNTHFAPPRSSSASFSINNVPSAPQEFAFYPILISHLLPTDTISFHYPYQVNSMSEHEVSRLERSPDALRNADIPTDPALENPPQHHVHDHGLPLHHAHMLQQEQHQDMQHHHDHDPDHDHDHMPHHDDLPDDMSSPDNQEPFSPRRGYTHKRSEEPPRNTQGKMICKFQSTCANITFERRCEWSKHMDKHDRPYKCLEPGCEKLQGFTYSGGLLRHQREVHKMHGGTKKALYCPEPNCKRNSGSGFTRKENLSEHIRRVHRRTTDGSEFAAQAQNGLDHLEAAAAAAAATEDDGMNTDGTERSSKRKRDDYLNGGDDLNGDFVHEGDAVKRLKGENQELKDRMKQMEDSMRQQQSMLQELLNRQQPIAPTASMLDSQPALRDSLLGFLQSDAT